MNFTHIRNKVKMLLREQKMVFYNLSFSFSLQYLQFYTFTRCFIYTIYNIYKVWVLLFCFFVVFLVNVVVVNGRGGVGSLIGMASE